MDVAQLFSSVSSLLTNFFSMIISWSPFSGVPIRLRILFFFIKLFMRYVHEPDGSIKRTGLIPSLANRRVPANPKHTSFGVATFDTHISCSDHSILIRLFRPTNRDQRRLPVILFFHGGGFSFCSAVDSTYDKFCRRIASRASAIIASVDYRLAPEHPYPAAYEDGMAALVWLKDRAAEENQWLADEADFGNCFVMGDSAGGNLAHHVTLMSAGQNLGRLQIRGRILLCPFFAGTEKLQSEVRYAHGYVTNQETCSLMWKSFLPAGADMDHMAADFLSPEHPPMAGLPSTLVQVDAMDYLHDRGLILAEELQRAGVNVLFLDYSDSMHDGAVFGFRPQRLARDIAVFVSTLVQ